MYPPVQQCTNCGASLSLDDLRKPNCTYCGTVYPHHAQAEQHAQVVGQVMNQMMAQQAQVQNQWRAGFGVGPMPPPPPGMPGAPGMPGGAFPGYGMPPPPGVPGSPYGDPSQMVAIHMANAARMSRGILIAVIAVVIGSFVLTGAIMAFTMMR